MEKVARYLRSTENGDFAYTADLFSPDAVLEQLPSRIYPNGIKFGVSRMAEAFDKGRKLLPSQSYELKSCVVADETGLSVEVLWTDTLPVAFWQPGSWLSDARPPRVFFNSTMERWSANAYDCFEPR